MSKGVRIELGGKSRLLRYTNQALEDIADATGVKDLAELFPESEDEYLTLIKSMNVLVWAGLLHEDDDLTQRQVGHWIDPADMERVSEAVGEALKLAFPEVRAEGNGRKKPKTGKRSRRTSG